MKTKTKENEMASPIELAPSLLADRSGMDSKKGVSEKAAAQSFEGILEERVAVSEANASDKDVETEPTEDSPSKTGDDETVDSSIAMLSVALPQQQMPIENKRALIEQPEGQVSKVSTVMDQVVRVEELTPKKSEQVAVTASKGIEVELPKAQMAQPQPVERSQMVAVEQPQVKDAPKMPKDWAKFVSENENSVNLDDSSQDLFSAVKEVPEKDGDFSQPMDLKTLSESLYVQKNLLNARTEDVSFSKQLDQFQASDASTIRPQVVKEMEPLVQKVLLTNSGGEMTIQLKPLNLGKVQVDVRLDGDLVKVNVQAEQPSTRMALQAQSQDLKQQLQSSGLRVEHLQIGSMQASESAKQNDSNAGHQQQNQNQQQQNQHQSNAHQQHSSRHRQSEKEFLFDAELKEQRV